MAEPKVPPPAGNPVFRMMGLPNFRLKLPSRNWSIFIGVVSTWTAAIVYDRQQKKRVQKKWCDVVSHLSKEPLPSNMQQRKLTIFLCTPPADSILTAREHYHEYIGPILVAAGLDWDVIEGRKEGDVRAMLAERIRKRRKLGGEFSHSPVPEDDADLVLARLRQNKGIHTIDGPAGDIVIGRNTWKEYIRGLHEGWLGPLDAPKSEEENSSQATTLPEGTAGIDELVTDRPHDIASVQNDDAEGVLSHLSQGESLATEFVNPVTSIPAINDASPAAMPTPEPDNKPEEILKEDAAKEDKPKKPPQPPPFIFPKEYPSASLSPLIPPEFTPSVTIPLRHILGFLNSHIRVYRYLTKRHAADEIGRQVAAACFAAYAPYERYDGSSSSSLVPSDSPTSSSFLATDEPGAELRSHERWEQEELLKQEELEWHKSVRKNHDPTKESLLLDDMVFDPRIAERMRKFVLRPSDEQGVGRAKEGSDSDDA